MAARLLPARKRRGAFAIYATCRVADDIVDTEPADDAATRLAAFRAEAEDAMRRRSDRPILRELSWAMREFGIPVAALTEMFDGVAGDLAHRPFDDRASLVAYCEGVASSVGEMTCAVFGVRSPSRLDDAVRHARCLGLAMQLTNILRDVGEDARRGRCYLPVDELGYHGLTVAEVLRGTVNRRGEAWRRFMALQVAQARELYRQSLPGIRLLASDAVRCAIACCAGYAEILTGIEAAGYDTFSTRVSTSRRTLLGVAWAAWQRRLPRLAESADAAGLEPDPGWSAR